MVEGLFSVLIDGEVHTFIHFDDIPLEFENLISFEPKFPEPPHTDEEHEVIHRIGDLLKELMKRETK
jgi:hypothetical protein